VPAAFSVNELDSTVSAFAFDPATKILTETMHLPAVPSSWNNADSNRVNAPAAVAVSACGRWLYASNRGHDSIDLFEITLPVPGDGSGPSIDYKESIPSGGSLPWSFCSVPPCAISDLVLVQNQAAPLSAGAVSLLPNPSHAHVLHLQRSNTRW
jgi:hypothetical protein